MEELFSEAIRALFFLIVDKKPEDIEVEKNRIGKRKICIKYDLIDSALIELLNRVIFISYSKGQLIFNPKVRIKKNKIIVKTCIIKDAFSLMEREIKAATYHDFSIKNKDGLYYTSIIFDI